MTRYKSTDPDAIPIGTRVRLKPEAAIMWGGTGTMLSYNHCLKDGYDKIDYGTHCFGYSHEWEILADQTPNPEHAACVTSELAREDRRKAILDKNRARHRQRFPDGKGWGWWTEERLADVLARFIQLKKITLVAQHFDLSHQRMRDVIRMAITRDLRNEGCDDHMVRYYLVQRQVTAIRRGQKLTLEQLRTLDG